MEPLLPNKMHCQKCKKFMGTYWLDGTDHNMGFSCPACLPEPPVLKEASDTYVPGGYIQDD